MHKPLFLHERAAFERFTAILAEHNRLPKGVVHCFTGSLKEVKTYLDTGYYIGFTGAVSDSKRFAHLEEVVRYVPLDCKVKQLIISGYSTNCIQSACTKDARLGGSETLSRR